MSKRRKREEHSQEHRQEDSENDQEENSEDDSEEDNSEDNSEDGSEEQIQTQTLEELEQDEAAIFAFVLEQHQQHLTHYTILDDGDTFVDGEGCIVILCWIRVSGRGQVTEIFIDEPDIEITWRLSIAMQIRIIRWWFFVFGHARYGNRQIKLIWIITIGTVNTDSIPDILSLFMERNNHLFNGARVPLHVAFLSRLHRSIDLLLVLHERFRIVVHLGRHNHNNNIVARPPWNHAVHALDISNYTPAQVVLYFAIENARWLGHWRYQFRRPIRMPPGVSLAAMANLGIIDIRMQTNMGQNQHVLVSLQPHLVPSPGMQNFMGMFPNAIGNGFYVAPLLHTSAGVGFDIRIGRLTWSCPYHFLGCCFRCFSEFGRIREHLERCRFIHGDPHPFPVITTSVLARPTARRIVVFLAQPRGNQTSYFSSVFTRFWRWPPLFPIPTNWTLANAVDDNYFRHNTDGTRPQVASNIVFREICLAAGADLDAYIERLAVYLEFYARNCARFYYGTY